MCNNYVIDSLLDLITFVNEPEKAICMTGEINDGMDETVKLLCHHNN
jgi:hypothetical protein